MFKKADGTLTIPTIIFTGLLLSTPITALASSGCEVLKGCKKKFCEIEKQLNIATQADQSDKVAGLTKALKEAKSHCTNKGIREELIEEIEEERKEILDDEKDLRRAQKDNKADKVRKYQEKINQKTNRVMQLESELSALD